METTSCPHRNVIKFVGKMRKNVIYCYVKVATSLILAEIFPLKIFNVRHEIEYLRRKKVKIGNF